MALTWNVKNVKYYQENVDSLYVKVEEFGQEYDDVNPETKMIIFSTMAIGIGNLSEVNAPEFYGRFKVLEKLDDFYLTSYVKDGELIKNYITPEIVHKHIGLVTNVGWESTTAWTSRTAKNTRFRQTEMKYEAKDLRSIIAFYSLEYKEFTSHL